MRFEVSQDPLQPDRLKEELRQHAAGACVCFEGWVRNVNEGEAVDGLSYEGFEDMVCAEGGRILEEAKARFRMLDARGIHRLGDLKLGEMAVWIGVSSAHRPEAFAAAAWILEELKARLPIWKKEAYIDQLESRWVGIKDRESSLQQRYARQLALPGLGEQGQERLSRSSVLVVGAGGLGCPALQYLAAAGVGQLRIVDGDDVSLDNLHRQILFGERDLGMNKAQAARRRLLDLNSSIQIEAHGHFANPDRLPALLDGVDLVLDGSDNFPSRFAVHDACWLQGIPLLQAAVHQWEGQLNLFAEANGGGCLRCLWPQEPEAGCVGSCADTGILGVSPGVVGLRMATEALKQLLGLPEALGAETLWLDLLQGDQQRIRRSQQEDCELCRRRSLGQVDGTTDLLHPASAQLDCLRDALWIDVREAEERVEEEAFLKRFLHLPVSSTAFDSYSFPGERDLLVACAAGARARKVQAQLLSRGLSRKILVWAAPISSLRAYI